MSILLLAVSATLSGLNATSNKLFLELGLGEYVGLYMLLVWGSGMVVSLIVRRVTRHRVSAKDVAVGLVMGITGGLAMITLLICLKSMNGVVVFSVRSCGNTVLTALLSYTIWREDLTTCQVLGIACGTLSIYLLL